MATTAPATVYSRTEQGPDGQRVVAKVIKFDDVALNGFTRPINLKNAKSVWIALDTAVAAEYYIPNVTGTFGTDDAFELSTTTNFMQMQASAASSGMNIVAPTTNGAGFIGGSLVPPYLSVKVTGGTGTKDVYIIISY